MRHIHEVWEQRGSCRAFLNSVMNMEGGSTFRWELMGNERLGKQHLQLQSTGGNLIWDGQRATCKGCDWEQICRDEPRLPLRSWLLHSGSGGWKLRKDYRQGIDVIGCIMENHSEGGVDHWRQKRLGVSMPVSSLLHQSRQEMEGLELRQRWKRSSRFNRPSLRLYGNTLKPVEPQFSYL